VGYLVTKKARCFGGDTLTATDIVGAKGPAEGGGGPRPPVRMVCR